jgi:hypothetical protein
MKFTSPFAHLGRRYTHPLTFRQKATAIFKIFFGGFLERSFSITEGSFQLGLCDILVVPAILDITTALVIDTLINPIQRGNAYTGLIAAIIGSTIMSPMIAISGLLRGVPAAIFTLSALPVILITDLIDKRTSTKVDNELPSQSSLSRAGSPAQNTHTPPPAPPTAGRSLDFRRTSPEGSHVTSHMAPNSP